MKINPSSTSTALDYGENPNKSSGDQGEGSQQGGDEYQPKVPQNEQGLESARNLRSRKASKKRQKKRGARKLSERRARQKDEGTDHDEDESEV
ncbi:MULTISPECIES: hypothetical protein [unclassified Endozoicomonas]|uniref:hypothetical protein n=1 Tax=unclassified Endozoicomonas TaxID=2644528 RepID=UPI0021477A44|nr:MULTISPECIES: hypothetical protein [unclassified Endozoicomonas]